VRTGTYALAASLRRPRMWVMHVAVDAQPSYGCADHYARALSFLCDNLQNPKVTADRAFNGFGTNFEGSPEPLYGSVFLPRKFKVAVTVPGDNSVDIFTNDVGVVVMTDDKGEVQGYNLLVGGGMGRTARYAALLALSSWSRGCGTNVWPLQAVKMLEAESSVFGVAIKDTFCWQAEWQRNLTCEYAGESVAHTEAPNALK
jgi:hypothetical protein